jgi:hypothetical protein
MRRDTHSIAIEQVDQLPVLRTCEDIIIGDGEDGQGLEQVILKKDDQNTMAIATEEMANQEYFVTKKM